MPSIRTLHNDELIQAQRSAIAILHKLMTKCDDPLEQRRIAVALLRTRPVKDTDPARTPTPGATESGSAESVPDAANSDSAEPVPGAADSRSAESAQTANSTPTPEPPTPPADTSRDCTHPALPPLPGAHYRDLMKRAKHA